MTVNIEEMSRIKSRFQKWLHRNRLELRVAAGLILVFCAFLVYFKFFYTAPVPPAPQTVELLEAQEKAVRFINNHFVYKRGVIKQFNPDLPHQKEEYLSETLGLWMLYLVESDRQKLFDDQTQYLKKYFKAPAGWVYWRIESDQVNSCNATLDDLRIAYAQKLAGKKWKKKEYVRLAHQIALTMKPLNLRDNYLVESYCENPNPDISELVDLSYLDLPALQSLVAFDKDWNGVLYRAQKLLHEGKTPIGFYYDKYQVLNKKYSLQDMNLINQLICAIAEEQMGESSKPFYEFLKKQYLKNGKILGRYHPLTGKPLVNYESPAVYGLFLSYAVAQKDHDLTTKLKDHLLRLQNRDGSFGVAPFEAFDHILILTALNHYQKAQTAVSR